VLIFGIILLIIGALVAAFVHHTIGIIIAVIGVALVLISFLFLADAEAALAAWQGWSG
jgi:hypothetical protein